jgi:hypothetical protein
MAPRWLFDPESFGFQAWVIGWPASGPTDLAARGATLLTT